MRNERGDEGQKHKPDRQYKKALLYFVVGYLVFFIFGAYSFLIRIGFGMGGGTEPAFSAGQLAFQYFFIFSGFVTAVVSQVWFLYIKPHRKSKNEEQQSSLLLYLQAGVVLLASLALVDYLVRTGAYYAGENAYWGETYPENTTLHVVDSVLRQVNGPVSLLFLILGPVYALLLSIQVLRVRREKKE